MAYFTLPSRGSFTAIAVFLFLASFQTLSAQCSMACNNNVTIALGSSCASEVEYDVILEDPDNPLVCTPNGPANYEVLVYNAAGTQQIPSTPVVNANYIGQTLMVKVRHIPSGNYCWGSVKVRDYQYPVLTCPPADTVLCGIAPVPAVTGNPTIVECSAYNATYNDVIVNTDCEDILTTITRTFIVTDVHNNASNCVQQISIQKPTLDMVQYPLDRDGMAAPALPCTNPNTTTSNTGVPTINGQPISPNCGILSTSDDLTIPLCGNTYKILRHWTILDWCSGEIDQHYQVITVMDQVAPVITCPANYIVNTSYTACVGNTLLPAATVSDNCNTTTVSFTGNGQTVNTNGGAVLGLPLGPNPFTYQATDACGNTATCSFIVTVKDQQTPTAICDELTTTSINSEGLARVYAVNLDDGSHDNCCLDPVTPFEIKRMSEPNSAYGPYVDFTCADAGVDVNVILRVRDCHANTNTCMIVVNVMDETPPLISCPPNTTVSCGSDLTVLDPFGSAEGFDNCSFTLSTIDTVYNIDNCGNGTIVRKFRVTDAEGNSDNCNQTINVITVNPFGISDITWPEDYDADGCTITGGLDPEDLPAPYNAPVINGSYCDLVGINHTDQLFEIAPPACFKILRTWTVVDWCQYEPNNGNGGIWTHTQTIKVFDSVDPVLTVPADLTFESLQAACGYANVTLVPATATDCNTNLTFTNSHNGGGANASDNYPFGTTIVTFTVTDGCGNSSHKTVSITVVDGKKPSVVCNYGLAVNIMQTGMISVNASLFNASSSDNCTAPADLQFSFSANLNDTVRIFDCDDAGTSAPIEMWVTDEEGNADFCQTFLNIQDNMGACNPALAIAGNVATEDGDMVEQVTVTLAGSMPMAPYTTGPSGSFNFEGLPPAQEYTIIPAKNMNASNGVTTYDLLQITKHILGVQPLGSPYRIIAADINNSGTITASDLIEMRKVILFINDAFPNNSSWRFVDAEYSFPNPANPFQEDFPEVHFTGMVSSNETANFVGIKTGDVNGSAASNSLLGGEDRGDDGQWDMIVQQEILEKGQTTAVSFLGDISEGLQGMQFTLQFDKDKLAYKGMTQGVLTGFDEQHIGTRFLEEGLLTFSWADIAGVSADKESQLMALDFEVLSGGRLSDMLAISPVLTTAEAYMEDGRVVALGLAFREENGTAMEIAAEPVLMQNQPNPFNGQTVIAFSLPAAAQASLSIFDVTGRKLIVKQGFFAAGRQEIVLDSGLLPASGVWYYRLDSGDFTATRKMIVLE